MNQAARLLGFAFANADFLFEVDAKGLVTFATGAASGFAPEDGIVGKPAARLFTLSEATKFATLSCSVGKAGRAGPFKLKLVDGDEVALNMFRLPENENRLSCTLARPGARGAAAGVDPRSGLSNRDGFMAAALEMAGENDALALVELPGLPGLGEAEAAKLLASIGTAFGKIGAKAAGRLSPSRFGIIADAVGGTAKLGQKIRAALKEAGAGDMVVEETLISLKGKDISNAQRDLVLRYVVDKFAKDSWTGEAASDVSAQFAQMMDETQASLRSLTETVADGSFALNYQPIVSLQTGATSHFEALARFTDGKTAETIGMVEALGISDAFDLAVAVKVLAAVEAKTSHGQHVAFNVSGKTICTASNFGLLAGLLARKRALSSRVMIEITESTQIANLDDAAKAVEALHAMGYRIGIDDFGAGAASLTYLHALPVDFVKFDGSLVKRLGQSQRDDALLAGMVKLCRELGVQSVAECIETEAMAASAKAMGFDLAQGYLYGAGTPELPVPQMKVLGKRKGVRESWG
jgi:EAL domain-containing protein (putative c-di-GMP-specific phosphodiesterase class I)